MRGVGYMAVPGIDSRLEGLLLKACDAVGVEPEKVRSRNRKREVALARQLYVMLAKQHTDHTLDKIGSLIGIDHATVIYHLRQAKSYQDIKDPLFMKLLARL